MWSIPMTAKMELRTKGIFQLCVFSHKGFQLTLLSVYTFTSNMSVCMKVPQSFLTLWDPMDYTVHSILQARILEWVAFPFSRGSSQPRDWTQASCIAGGFFTSWATWRGIIICRQTGLSETSLSRSEKNLCITVCLLTQHFIIFSYNILLLSPKNSLQTSWFSLRTCPTYAQDNKA